VNETAISWTDRTWNPVSGCSRISEGCRYCYAERISLKFRHTTLPWTAANAAQNVVCHPDRLDQPFRGKAPARIFVNSMSDLWHPLVPDAFIWQVFDVMAKLPRHTFQILTKRPERAAGWLGDWPANVWQGTSVEDERAMPRIDHLRRCGAAVRFLSCEPLIGPLPGLSVAGISWVIVGGESGPHLAPPAGPERWLRQEWARDIRDACIAAGTAYFFKQRAGIRTELHPFLTEPDGSCWEWHQFPDDLAAPRFDHWGDERCVSGLASRAAPAPIPAQR